MKTTKLKPEASLSNIKAAKSKPLTKTQPNMDGEDFLADTPEKGKITKPNSKTLDGEKFLSTKEKKIKSFESFVNENYDNELGELEELDLVTTIGAVSDDIPSGSHGTIVHKYDNDNYEVEFIINGKNYVETLGRTQLKKSPIGKEDMTEDEFLSLPEDEKYAVLHKQYLDVLKEIKIKYPIQEIVSWLNKNNIDYYNWTDLDMYIYYLGNKRD